MMYSFYRWLTIKMKNSAKKIHRTQYLFGLTWLCKCLHPTHHTAWEAVFYRKWYQKNSRIDSCRENKDKHWNFSIIKFHVMTEIATSFVNENGCPDKIDESLPGEFASNILLFLIRLDEIFHVLHIKFHKAPIQAKILICICKLKEKRITHFLRFDCCSPCVWIQSLWGLQKESFRNHLFLHTHNSEKENGMHVILPNAWNSFSLIITS